MDVSSAIASVIPSLDGVVLDALSRTTAPMTLTDVHRLGGAGSLSGVRRVLLRLVAEGIVDLEHDRYRLNRDHIATPAILQLAALHGELVRRIRQEAEKWVNSSGAVDLLGMFGSAARRDGNSRSDIDLLLVSSDPKAEQFAERLAELVRRWTGNPAHVLVRSRDDLAEMRRAGEPIILNWERDLLEIFGRRDALTVWN